MLQRFEAFVSGITVCHKYIQRIKSMEMTELGLKGTHVMCLFYLHHNPQGLTAAQLCQLCAEDKAAISRSLKYLEERGYVRAGESSKKYKKPVALTAEGKDVAERITRRSEGFFLLAGDGLCESDREVLYRGLQNIQERLIELCEKYED